MALSDIKKRIETLSLEFSFSVFRISGLIRNSDIKSRIEHYAVKLVEESTLFEISDTVKYLTVLERLVVFAEQVGEVQYIHSQALYKQISGIKSSAEEYNKLRIADFNFTLPELAPIHKLASLAKADLSRQNGAKAEPRWANKPAKEKEGSRIELISDLIRQSGNTAMKSIVAAFPDVSERTLRYDLQRLCEEGQIERVGAGGPSTFYRARSN